MLGNCETAYDAYESVQNEQMAAQNRFEFASYFREQRAKQPRLRGYLATAARVNSPLLASGAVDLFILPASGHPMWAFRNSM